MAVKSTWNGSTEITAWKVYAGVDPRALSKVKQAAKTGFETATQVDSPGPYFQIKAINEKGKVIGVSKVVRAVTV